MECSKSFTIDVPASCTGLASDATWVYNPNNNPNQPPPAVSFSYTFEGYHGTWSAIRNGGAAAGTIVQWHTNWTSVIGQTLSVRATIVGSVTRGPVASSVICRADANGNQVTQTQICASNMTTAVNLDVTAQDASLGGATFIDINHFVPADDTYSLTGDVFVSCA